MAEKEYNNGIRKFIWSKLVKLAKTGKNCCYSDVVCSVFAKYQIPLPNEIGYLLGPIMEFCHKKKLPPLTSLIVNKKTRIPGEGLTRCKICNQRDLEKVYKRVSAYKWEKIQNPFVKYDLKNLSPKVGEKKSLHLHRKKRK